MPELLEVERYARLARRTIGRRIERVDTPDAWFLKRGADADAVATVALGATVGDVRRIGKLLLLDLADGPSLGLRFGMTGRLIVDGELGIGDLEYGSSRLEPEWVRFAVGFAGGGELAIIDPRRLGGVELAPLEERLGPDARTITLDELRGALDGGRGPLKARLMDQARVAGLGNLLTDEVLWRARLDPTRAAGSLDEREVARLHATVHEVLDELDVRGGSHTGDLQIARAPGAGCPRCGAVVHHAQTGGRSTYWCAACAARPARRRG